MTWLDAPVWVSSKRRQRRRVEGEREQRNDWLKARMRDRRNGNEKEIIIRKESGPHLNKKII